VRLESVFLRADPWGGPVGQVSTDRTEGRDGFLGVFPTGECCQATVSGDPQKVLAGAEERGEKLKQVLSAGLPQLVPVAEGEW
jgi:hypothetical protein